MNVTIPGANLMVINSVFNEHNHVIMTYVNMKLLRRQVVVYCDIVCHTDKEAVF